MNETLLFALKVSLEKAITQRCSMIAENEFRDRANLAPAYSEGDFINIDKKLNDILKIIESHSNEIDPELMSQLKNI